MRKREGRIPEKGEKYMLAFLMIQMEWHKEERNPEAAAARQKYYRPLPIEEGVNLSGEGIFVVRHRCFQRGIDILTDWDASDRLDRELRMEGAGRAFTGSEEHRHRGAGQRVKSIQKSKGSFYSADRVDIPCIAVEEEPDGGFRIRWHDDGQGMPRRRGGNEEMYRKGARLAGQLNVRNETAFILKPGEAGVLKYNYRCTSWDGQWYRCYYVYAVSTDRLTRECFLRDYDYEYHQLADLF